LKRAAWVLATAGLLTLSWYLVVYRWADVAGNLEAQVVITTPAFVAHHLLIRRHVDRRHAETRDALAEQPHDH
jgi:hypothetical protein